MTRIIIAEKEKVASVIAEVLGNPKKNQGYYECGDTCITWTNGHILELCTPEDYDEKYKNWSLDHLPIFNNPWKYKVIQGKGGQFKVITSLLGKADEIIHAGDTDGEGQLLVDEVLHFLNIKTPVKRVLINDNNPRLVKKALDSLRDNSEFQGLSNSALARSLADQFYGFNMTRLYTLKARDQGADGVFSVGRVQTPILGLIVRRDREIESHKKHFFYTLKADVQIDGKLFSAVYSPSEDAPTDDKGRITDEAYITRISGEAAGQEVKISDIQVQDKKTSPPLPYDILELQAEANRKFKYSFEKTLNITQLLKDKDLITYNRSDCRYLSEEQHSDAPLVLETIAQNSLALQSAVAGADPSIKGPCFNDGNVSAHHGIVPTEARYDLAKLSQDEQKIYLLIARQYVAQFYPDYEYTSCKVVLDIAGHTFKASSTTERAPGWKVLYKNDQDNEEVKGEEAEDETEGALSELQQFNGVGVCKAVNLDKKETKPPKRYTEGSLGKDLKRIAKYVRPEIAKLLKDKDKGKKGEQGGIGTPATRHTFVPTLEARGYLAFQGDDIISTKLGREFHDTLPGYATEPDLTALWHEQQKEIEAGNLAVDSFMEGVLTNVATHIEEMRNKALNITVETHQCPVCNSGLLMKRRGKSGHFWGCNRYPDCGASYPDKAGKPDLTPKKEPDLTEHDCPDCGSKLIRRKSVKKPKSKKSGSSNWYGCSGYPSCKSTFFEKDGKPDFQGKENK